jgi:hypothetical protein
MITHLRVSWCEHPAPRDVEKQIINALRPPLNVEHASGPTRDIVKAARRAYYSSAGPRPGSRPNTHRRTVNAQWSAAKASVSSRRTCSPRAR